MFLTRDGPGAYVRRMTMPTAQDKPVRSKRPHGCLRAFLGCCAGLAILLVLLVLALLIVCRGAIYRRYVLFPRQAAAWAANEAHRQPVALDDGWKEFRGVLHAHSELSGDCRVSFPEILEALKKADVDFICMTDHCDDHKADYSKGWKGLHDGIPFVRGYEFEEAGYGFMPWGLPDNTMLDDREDPAALAKRIHDLGGVLLLGHSEDKRPWDLPEVDGMEIYNVHSDMLMNADMLALAPDILLSFWKYPDQAMRLLFHRPRAFLQHWDTLNLNRHVTGIAANDSHQNFGIRGVYTSSGTLKILDTGHANRCLKEVRLNRGTRWILETFWGPLAPERQLFRVDLDRYDRSVRYVNTHLLMHELSEPAVLDALRQGRAFVGFDMLADARGFKFFAESPKDTATMGGRIMLEPELRFRMAAPNACHFTVFRDGSKVAQGEGISFDWSPSDIGKYRVEAELYIAGEWTPWVYTNPIEVVPSNP